MNDLLWLKKIKKDAKQHPKLYCVKIYQCSYKDGTCFLIEPNCKNCNDIGTKIANCEGEILCIFGGYDGALCTELNVDFDNMKLIWKD